MDYAYTIGGWLKGVNGAALDEQKEMGQDGKVTNLSTTPYYPLYTDIHQWTGRDAFGYVIGYFGDDTLAMRDYTSITATANGNRWLCKIPITTGLGDNLYNGNIRHVVLGLRDQTEDTIRNRATAYKHDQLQRLKETYNYFNWDNSYASILSSTKTGLREKVWYDANGNIQQLKRYDDAGTPTLMDDFSYNYYGNVNRLGHVDDAVSTGGISTDKEDQDPNNYSYDEIGQLTADVKEGIDNINWNVRNKPTEIEKTGDVKILFEYDEMGHRVKKEVRDGNENLWTQQWYVLDPQGNPVAVYEHKYTNPSTNTYNEYLDLKEHQVYGGERLGTKNYTNYHLWGQTFTNTSFTVDGEFNHPTGHTVINFPAGSYELHDRKTGTKTYEIKGHTNNVMAVVTDFKKPYAACTTGVANVEYYTADVISYTDYFVFGGTMNNRNLSSNEYRYGFQGQERDNEIKGNDNSVNYEYRMHDPQYGRFLSIDPLASKYPHNSPYAFSENRVIASIELEGLEARDLNGNIIAVDRGDPGDTYEQEIASTIDSKTGVKTITYAGHMSYNLTIFTNEGTPTSAEIVHSAATWTETYDAQGNYVSTSPQKEVLKNGEVLDQSAYQLMVNCHGYTFAEGKLWVTGVTDFLKDDYTETAEQNSDIVVFSKSEGYVPHSAKRNKNGTYNSKDGMEKLEKNVSLKGAQEGYEGSNASFFKKNGPDKKVKETRGTVKNGIRTIEVSYDKKKKSAQYISDLSYKIKNSK